MTAAHPGGRREPAGSRLQRCRSGSVSLEFALILILLIPLVVAATDFGRFSLELASLSAAARSGAQYATRSQSFVNDTDDIIAAVRQDAGDPSLAVTTRTYCMCPGETVEDNCTTGLCGPAGDQYIPMYVEVTVAKDLPLLFDYPGWTDVVPLSAQSTMRAR